jgi:hypothetical protein
MRFLAYALICCLAVSSIAVSAQEKSDKAVDVTGAWALEVTISGGGTGTPTVTLKQDGEKLTGHYSSAVLGEHDVTGSVKGNAVTFTFEASLEGTSVKVTYSGTVDKDTMKGTVNLGDLADGTFTAKKK